MSTKNKEQSSLKTLKRRNRRDVLDMLRHSDEALSILYISKKTTLSKMTVHKILGHLVEQGLAVSVGKGDSGEDGGKRPTLFTINPNYRFILSVKIAETHVAAAVTNLQAQILKIRSLTYARETRLSDILRHIKTMLREMLGEISARHEECVGIVVGCHGIADSETGVLVTSPHFASWGSDIPIRDRIREMYPSTIPVYIDNWVRYFSYGEMKTRLSKLGNFMVIGTEMDGIVGGLVLGGELQSGNRGLSGEIGHMIVAPELKDVCVCGGIGCLEVAASFRRMVEIAQAGRSDWSDSQLFRGKGKQLTHDTIFAAANSGDILACAILDDVIRYFAICINNITQTCDPGRIIIQGEYAKAGDYFLNQLNARLQRMSLLRMDKGIRVEYSEHGDEWTLRGGAHYAADIFFAHLEEL